MLFKDAQPKQQLLGVRFEARQAGGDDADLLLDLGVHGRPDGGLHGVAFAEAGEGGHLHAHHCHGEQAERHQAADEDLLRGRAREGAHEADGH